MLYDAFEAPWAFSVFGELEGLGEWIRTFLVDPCAGVNPFDPVPDGCPPGTGATLVGLDLPPEPPFAFFGSGGHYLEPGVPDSVPCPADTPGPADDSQAAVTLFSRTPIQSATLRIRPYGSSVPWTDLDGTIASPQSDIDLWNARFAEREYDVDWGTVAICFLVERDPAIAYDIEAVGVDIFSRDVTSTRGLIGIVDPDLRPPTTGRVLPNGPTAQVEARTLAGGTVRFASSDIDPADVGDGSGLDCAATPGDWRFNPAPAVVTTDTRPSYPIGLYDPAFERRYTARIPMSVAGALWVCAWIYPSENPLTPIAVDSMLFTAPTAQLPRVVLQGIRRLGDETIDRVLVTAGRESGAGSRDRCSTGGYAGYDLPPGETVSIEDTLWQCDGVPLDLDADRSTVVPVIVRRNLSGEDVIEEVAIRVSPDDCWAEPCVSRPREWYEIPIPRGSRTLCGGFGGGGGCDVEDAAGIAVIRVDYPVIEGSTDRNGGVTLLDQIDRDVRSLEPTFTRPEVTFTGGDPFVRDARVTFFTDRPMRMGLTFNDLAIVNAQPCFEGDPDVNLTDGFQDEFSLDISGLCSGNSYDVTLRGIDEAGTEWQWDNALAVTAPAVSNDFDVEIDFLGGVGEETHGFFYRFNVKVEGQSTTAYWYDFTGSQGSSANCYGLTGTTARSRGYHPPIWYSPNELTVEVNYTITTTGVGDCSGRGETGYGANTFTGSFTVADLRAGTPLVLESPDSSPLDMRVTLTPGLRWRVRR